MSPTGVMTVAQIEGGQLQGLGDNGVLVVGGALLALAALAAWSSARAPEFRSAAAYWLGGLVVAAATGYLIEDLGMAMFLAGVYGVFAAGVQYYTFEREPWEAGLWGAVAIAGTIAVIALSGPKTGAFILASSLIVFAALKTLASDRLVHAALWLAGVLVGIAGIFLSLGAEFLAAIQILVYVGAVITLFLFTVMLTEPTEDVHGLDDLELPPGVHVESIKDLNPATPAYGVGPFKGLADTNPRKPVKAPDTLYGVALTDGVHGRHDTVRRGENKKEE